MKKSHLLMLAGFSAAAAFSLAAQAVEVGVNIGLPGAVLTAPAPVAVVSPGWYGDRYYDGSRYWNRDDWNEHQRHGKDHRHCPPGHAKKGEC
jgi:hypothetical protein